jgi:hypothetical protein
MEKFETDPEFRESVELAELRLSEPDYPSVESQEFEAQESTTDAERLAA